MTSNILDLCDFKYELQIHGMEYYSEEDERFHNIPERTIYLNHSLVSIAKWEAKYKVHFLGNDQIDPIAHLDYIRMMVIYDPVPSDSDFVLALSREEIDAIKGYMNDPMTATNISNQPGGATSYQYITSELIYSWMASLQIPAEYQYWHINRLLVLINATNENQKPKKKMDPEVAMARQRAANAARRAKYNSKG